MSTTPARIPQRLIFHVDLDAFYASVEELDFPELRGEPVIVGGLGGRGVVSAANYPARRFGVHSAMPMHRARQLCPRGHYRNGRMERYRALSQQVFDCFRALTPDVEGLSLDEAFLDLSADPDARDNPEAIARALKDRIREQIGLIASVGIAPNKFLAKLASDIGKPDGLVQVSEAGRQAFLDPLPVERLWGVGETTTQRLRRAGLSTFGSLRRVPEPQLRGLLGRSASRIKALAEGKDDRPVEAHHVTRSISAEQTYGRDLNQLPRLQEELSRMAEEVAARLRGKSLETASVAIKLRTPDFHTMSRQRKLNRPSAQGAELRDVAQALATEWWQAETARLNRSPRLRLAGLAARELVAATGQLGLFGNQARGASTDALLDQARSRFGDGVLQRGIRRDKLGTDSTQE
ncbi:DNA polymerase-4 [Natronospira proteinivora]|uniref:DNA polymerase IV n=1 Tax=Natronospira proteinivora TaxID=1807133 RepID=A0ABT1GAU9_9GAMM|nr:DNA polymerase IV [Natronospira proteinivora]MCP1728445.1 DNA polymerase-4 [Natronospira proteinivora]